jgi:hypothetical protein
VAEKLPVSAVARRLHREHGASWFNSQFPVLRHASLFALWQAPPARLTYVTEQSVPLRAPYGRQVLGSAALRAALADVT